MSALYLCLCAVCAIAFAFLLREWFLLERDHRRRQRVLEVHLRKLRDREIF